MVDFLESIFVILVGMVVFMLLVSASLLVLVVITGLWIAFAVAYWSMIAWERWRASSRR